MVGAGVRRGEESEGLKLDFCSSQAAALHSNTAIQILLSIITLDPSPKMVFTSLIHLDVSLVPSNRHGSRFSLHRWRAGFSSTVY